ncbi:MAG TPA: BatD family protein [Kofleriaceae bacterium]|nr:BatD family protein [Kofleriaceae bacterium]
MVVTVGQRRAHSAAPDPPGSDPPAAVPGFVPPPKDHHEPAFLYAVADRHQVFAGDQVTVTWLLYTRTEVTGFEPTPPDTSGLWSRVLEEPERYFSYRDATVGEVRYRVARVGKRALFPLAAGDITVPPLTARLTTEDHPLWPGIEVASAPVTVEVMPLPAGAPAGFDDRYVGQFEITAKVARTEIDAGESFSLTVTVTGDGAIGRTVAPALAWDGFRIRQPRDSRDHIATSGGVVHGSRAYTYWITPERGGAQTLPGIALSFFDPQDRAYKTVKTAPIAVLVRGDPGKIGDPAGAGAGLPEDIRLIHTGAARVWGPKNWLVRFPFLWALVALGPLVFCGVVIGDRVRRGRRRETPRVRLLRARGEARARLKVAEIHLRGDRSEEFYRELSRALLEFLGHQLGRPLSSMTRQKLCAYLGERGFPEPTVAALGQQLESHDQARFAPASPGEAEMRAALRRVRELLRKLERAPAGEEAGA